MQQLSETGSYTMDAETLARIQAVFHAGFCGDDATKQAIRTMKETENYLCDPHSAVAFEVYHQYVAETGDKETPTVVVSTASPYSLQPACWKHWVASCMHRTASTMNSSRCTSLSALTGVEVPQPIQALAGKPVRFEDVSSVADMRQSVLRLAGLS